MKRVLFLSILSLVTLYGRCQVTMESLLKEMASAESLAKFPSPEFKLLQFSSYDRMSVAAGEPGWFANFDLSNFLRVERREGRREFVLFDHQGPGAIVRFWMTFAGIHPGEGVMRIYIDGSEIPAVQGSPFELISGGKLAPEPLSSSVPKSYRYDRRGHNLYLPIPYSLSCKITYESEFVKEENAGFGGENVYYNINYREYPAGTKVESFCDKVLKKNSEQIKSVAQKLAGAVERQVFTAGLSKSKVLERGECYSESLTGEGAIGQISIKVENPGSEDFNLNQALRSVVLEISFDGVKRVWSPVGDFFGTGYKISPHRTFFTQVSEDGSMTSLWVMPFREGADVTIRNLAGFPVKMILEISKIEWKWNDRSMHFGASWREYHRLDAGGVKSNADLGEGAFDINYVTLKGKGIYVGDVLTLFNSAYAWWGEGDEKIYVDGESFPSHFGTGTEDYYGYAWCRPEKFTDHPFISQPDGSGNLEAGYTVNLRYRSLDKIPFKESLVLNMEVWSWTDATLNYSPVTFYYQLPDHILYKKYSSREFTDPTGSLLSGEEGATKKVVTDRLELVPAIVREGRSEFDQLDFHYRSAGRVSFDRSVGFNTSNKAFVNWSGASAGDTLVVRFYTNENLKEGAIKIGFIKGANFGRFRILLNGKPFGDIFDGSSDTQFVTEVDFGRQTLNKGENQFTFINLGPSHSGQKNSFVGIDYIDFNF